MTTLAGKHCVPCQGGLPPLSREDAKTKLEAIPQWQLNDDATTLVRRFEFKNFLLAADFVSQAGDIAEAEGHHPDITFGWGYAEITIQTHKINGLHENDFILAAKIGELV